MASSFSDLIVKVGADITDFQTKLNSVSQTLEQQASQWASSGALLSAGLTLPLTLLGGAAIKTAGEFEQTEIAFTTMLGSAAAATTMLNELKAFAASTPFEFPDLVNASKRLIALGFEASQVIPVLRTIGDAAAGLGGGAQVIDRLTLALGQMTAKGKVSAQEMNQFAEAGIGAWQMVADKIGVSIPEAMKLAEKGAIAASVAVPAILEGMTAKFGGMMAAQSKTFLGQWSNFKDQITFTLMDIGEALLPTAQMLLNSLQPVLGLVKDIASGFAGLDPNVQKAVLAVVALVAAIGPMLLLMSATVTAFITLAPLVTGMAATVGTLTLAVGSGLVGALSAAEVAALGLSAAMAALFAAFAGAKLGLFIYDMDIANDKLRAMRDWIYGIDAVARDAAKQGMSDLENNVEKLRLKLVEHGVVVDRGAMSLEQYADALRAAVLEHGRAEVSTKKLHVEQETAAEKAKKLKEEEKALKEELEKLSWEMANDVKNGLYWQAQKEKLTKAAKDLADEEAKLTKQLEDLDAEMAALARSTPLVTAETQELLDTIAEASIAASGINKLGDAYRTLGITVTTADLQKKADDMRAAYDVLAEQGGGDLLVLQRAWVAVQEAEKAAKAAIGEWTPAMEEALQSSKSKLSQMEGHITPLKNKWTELAETIRGEVTNAILGMERALIDWDWQGFKDSVVGLFKEIGFAVLDSFIKPAREAIATFISETITDLLSGKGLGGVLQNIKDIGSTMADVFGGGAKTAGGVASTAGGAASSGGIGSTVASTAASGAAAWVGAIGSIGSMISGFIGNVQNAHQETSLNAIEHNTRYSMMFLGERADGGILGVLFRIAEDVAWGPATKAVERIRDEMLLLGAPYLNPSLDAIKGHTESMRDSLLAMKDVQSQRMEIYLQIDGRTIATAVLNDASGQLRLQGQMA